MENIVGKAVDAEAKAALRPRSHTRETNQHCLQGSRPATTNASAQGQPIKDPKVEDPKARSQESKAPTSLRYEDEEDLKKGRKKKGKRERRYRLTRPQDSAPASGVNAINTSDDPSGGRAHKNLTQVTCYDCDNKGHYSRSCLDPLKLKSIGLGTLHVGDWC